MELFKLQTKLMAEHPELKQKRLVLQYYVSLECIEKQRKIVNWWNCMIQSAVRVSCQVFLSPADLENVFCLHGLKPVPLEAVLNTLQQNEKIEWRNRDKIIDPDAKQNKSLLKRIIGALFPQKSTKQKLSRYTSLQNQKNSKILSVSLLSQNIGRIKQIIETQMEHDKNISYDYIMEKVKQRLKITNNAIGFLIEELENKGWIIVEEVGGKKVIIFSENSADYSNKKWVEAQKQKFILNYNINALQTKIEVKLKQQNQKIQQAKGVLQRDKQKAKIFLAQARNIKKSRQAFQTRTSVLRDSLHQLEMNEQNFKLTQIMATTQKVIQQSLIDPSQIDAIKQKNMEIQIQQKQISNGFQQLNNIQKDDDHDDQVEELLNELQADINKSKLKKNRENSANKFVSNNFDDDEMKRQLFNL